MDFDFKDGFDPRRTPPPMIDDDDDEYGFLDDDIPSPTAPEKPKAASASPEPSPEPIPVHDGDTRLPCGRVFTDTRFVGNGKHERHGFSDVMHWEKNVHSDPSCSPGAKLLALTLVRWLNHDEGQCWMSNSTLAEHMSVTERTIQRGLGELELCGHIRREDALKRGPDGRQRKVRLVIPTYVRGIKEFPVEPIKTGSKRPFR